MTDSEQLHGNEKERTLELIAGPVVGKFTLTQVASSGEHPEAVRAAWEGVPLPVRRRFAGLLGDTVQILCIDGFDALVSAGSDEDVLQYWVDLLDGRAGPDATFNFNPADGVYTAHEQVVKTS